MANPTTPGRWPLHPGDWVLAEPTSENGFTILAQTPSDLEAQRLLQDYQSTGRRIAAFKYVGKIPCSE